MKALDIPNEVLKAIQAILVYLWNDEEADYWAASESERKAHVFRELTIIRRWLMQKKTLD
jgi:hypothetical protein